MAKVYVTSVWGFEPDKWAGQGFSNAGTRDNLLRDYATDDYLLLVATFGDEAVADEKGKLLGLAKIGKKALPTQQVVEPSMYALNRFQTANGIKWPYSVPFTQAWHFDAPLPERRTILPRIQDDKLGMKIGTGFELLTNDEASAVLALPRTETKTLYKSASMLERERFENNIALQRDTRKGPPPSFFKSLAKIEDGEAFVYLLQFDGDLEMTLGKKTFELGGKQLFKVGWSVDPVKRQETINAHMPDPQLWGWRLKQFHKFDSRLTAYGTEQAILNDLQRYKHRGEILLCKEGELLGVWNRHTQTSQHQSGDYASMVQSMVDNL